MVTTEVGLGEDRDRFKEEEDCERPKLFLEEDRDFEDIRDVLFLDLSLSLSFSFTFSLVDASLSLSFEGIGRDEELLNLFFFNIAFILSLSPKEVRENTSTTLQTSTKIISVT